MGEHEDGRRLSASQAEQVRRAYNNLTALPDFDVSKMIPSLTSVEGDDDLARLDPAALDVGERFEGLVENEG
jgi:hypothetical protein